MPNGRAPLVPGKQSAQEQMDRIFQYFLAGQEAKMGKRQMKLTEDQVKKQDLIKRWEMTRGNMSDEEKAEWRNTFKSDMPEYPMSPQEREYELLTGEERKNRAKVNAGLMMSEEQQVRANIDWYKTLSKDPVVKAYTDILKRYGIPKTGESRETTEGRRFYEKALTDHLGIKHYKIPPRKASVLGNILWNFAPDRAKEEWEKAKGRLREGEPTELRPPLQRPPLQRQVPPGAPGPIQRRLRPPTPGGGMQIKPPGQPSIAPPSAPPAIPKSVPPAEETTDEDYVNKLMKQLEQQ